MCLYDIVHTKRDLTHSNAFVSTADEVPYKAFRQHFFGSAARMLNENNIGNMEWRAGLMSDGDENQLSDCWQHLYQLTLTRTQ
jgi:hypothetical protein